MQTINRQQLSLLQGFYTHCFCVYHEKEKQAFSFYAEQLDQANIPWSIQNMVAEFAETRESIGLYLTTLLKERDITVT